MVAESLSQNPAEVVRPYHIEASLYPIDRGLLLHETAALIAKFSYQDPSLSNLHLYCDRKIRVVTRKVALLGEINGPRKPLDPGIGDMRWTVFEDERIIYIGTNYEVGFQRNRNGVDVRVESTKPFERLVYVPRIEIIDRLRSVFDEYLNLP